MCLCGAHWGWALPSAGIKPWVSGWLDRVGSACLEMTRSKGMRETTRSNNQAVHSSPAVIREIPVQGAGKLCRPLQERLLPFRSEPC